MYNIRTWLNWCIYNRVIHTPDFHSLFLLLTSTLMYDYRRVDTSKDHVSAVTTFPKGPPHFCSFSYIRFPAFVSLFFLFSLLSSFEQQLRYLDDRRGLLHCPPPLPLWYFNLLFAKTNKNQKAEKMSTQNVFVVVVVLGHSSPSDNTIHNIPGWMAKNNKVEIQMSLLRDVCTTALARCGTNTVLFIHFTIVLITSRRLLFWPFCTFF